MPDPTPPTCLNCGATLTDAFCSACGQPAQSPIKPLGDFLRESLTELFSLDGAQIRSLRALVTRPGFLTAEYLAGRRARYVHPMRLFVWVGVLSYLLTSLFPQESLVFSMGPRLFGSDALGLDALFLALMIPAGALAHWVVLRKQIAFFIGHLVLVLHLVTFSFVFAPIEAGIDWATSATPMLSMVVLVAPIVWGTYWVLALARVLGITAREALLKAFLVYWAFLFALSPVILLDLLVHG